MKKEQVRVREAIVAMIATASWPSRLIFSVWVSMWRVKKELAGFTPPEPEAGMRNLTVADFTEAPRQWYECCERSRTCMAAICRITKNTKWPTFNCFFLLGLSRFEGNTLPTYIHILSFICSCLLSASLWLVYGKMLGIAHLCTQTCFALCDLCTARNCYTRHCSGNTSYDP